MPKIGGVILGVVVVGGINIASAFVNPPIPATEIAPPQLIKVERVQWKGLAVTPEGLLFQGDRPTDRFPDAHIRSGARFEIISQPMNGITGPESTTEYQALMCEPRTFHYTPYYKDDVKVLQAIPTFLIEPVIYQWFINHDELSTGATSTDGTSSITYIGSIKTAVPPPDGHLITGHEIVLHYALSHTNGFLGPVKKLTLSPRSGDLRYDILAEMRATDAVGRVYWDGREIHFEGVTAEYGQDYYDYREECFKKLQESMKVRAKSAHPKFGEPQQAVDRAIDYLRLHIEARSPGVSDVINAAIQMHGLEAVNKALVKNISKI